MGKVVKLEGRTTERPPSSVGKRSTGPHRLRSTASVSPASSARKRAHKHKIALVLGGGGFTGGVYEVGALRALDLLWVNRTVNQFDVYVGTSAGAFIAALCANGVTPEEMMRVVSRQGPQPFRDIDLGDLLHLNLIELARKSALMPVRMASLARQFASQFGAVSLMDLLAALGQGMPSGIYTGIGIERYLRRVLSDPDRTDDFRELECELYLTATDLDTCERIVFGQDEMADVPISTAVRASGALPMVYSPVLVGDRELVDGGLTSTTNLDVAVEAGAKLVVVINPLVPFVNDFKKKIRTLRGWRPRRVSDMGFPQIGYQTFKLLTYQRLHEMANRWEERYPGVDIMLIEPEPDDELMFQTSMMNFTSRIDIARHGFQSVTYHLAGEYEHYREICARHDIEISPTRVRKVIKHFDAEQEQTSGWRKILEGTTGALLRQSGSVSG